MIVSTTGYARAADPPNIVFILADDLGWSDLGCYGSTYYKTPNFDALAKRGLLFRQAYAANPLCSPTRASIMTGQYPARLGITAPVCHQPEVRLQPSVADKARPDQKCLAAQSATRLDTKYVTLAELLREKGYAMGHFGKWHFGREPYSALEHGFEVDVPHWFGPGPAGSYVRAVEVSASLAFSRDRGRAHRRSYGGRSGEVHSGESRPTVLYELLELFGACAAGWKRIAYPGISAKVRSAAGAAQRGLRGDGAQPG